MDITLNDYLKKITEFNNLNIKEQQLYLRLIQIVHTKKIKLTNKELSDSLTVNEKDLIISKDMVAKFIPKLHRLGLIHTETRSDSYKLSTGFKHARMRYITLPTDILGIIRHDKSFRTLEQIHDDVLLDLLG